jgi:hypothetical protein
LPINGGAPPANIDRERQVVAYAVNLPVERRLKPCEARRRHTGEFDELGDEIRLIEVAALGRQLGPAASRSAPLQRQRTLKSNEPGEQCHADRSVRVAY